MVSSVAKNKKKLEDEYDDLDEEEEDDLFSDVFDVDEAELREKGGKKPVSRGDEEEEAVPTLQDDEEPEEEKEGAVSVTPTPKEEEEKPVPKTKEMEDEEDEASRLKIFAVTTPIGQERAAADSMLPRINAAKHGIVSLFCPTKLKGFILVEAYDVRELKRIVRGVPKVRRVVEGEKMIAMDEIEKFLTPKPVLEGIRPGNIVELISGPFKGEKAKVQHVDNDKEEITVELFEAMVPIPVTVKGEHVRLLEK